MVCFPRGSLLRNYWVRSRRLRIVEVVILFKGMVDCIKLFNNYEALTKLSYRRIKLSEVIRLATPAFLHGNSQQSK